MSGMVFIPDDGFTFTDVMPECAGLYPAVTYTYRPAVQKARYEFQAAVNPADRAARSAEIISGHVKELKVGDQTMALTPEQAARLMPGIAAHMLDRILGYAGPAEASAKN
jgi:hypothetical protein